jgi:hypothetical protein
MDAPMTPAPMMMTSALRGSIIGSLNIQYSLLDNPLGNRRFGFMQRLNNNI